MAYTSIPRGLQGIILLTTVTAAAPVLAVTADDVVCDKCVQTSDLAGGAVSTAKLKNKAVATNKLRDGAVTTAKIRNGAVKYGKLDANLKNIVDMTSGLAVSDYKAKASSVTKKVFSLSGDFGTCGGAGNPDTEVRTFTETSLGGGVTKEVQTRKRFVGGAGGTKCNTLVVTLIKSADAVLLVQHKAYNKAGVLQKNYNTGYDKATCPDCGIKLAGSNMVQGIDWASANEWSESKSGKGGIVMSKVVLTDAGFDQTVQEGTANEATFSSCTRTWEDRRTSGPWGNRTTGRIACQDIGIVLAGQTDNTDGTPRERMWELKSYTTSP